MPQTTKVDTSGIQFNLDEFVFNIGHEGDAKTTAEVLDTPRVVGAKPVTLEQIGELVDVYAFAKIGILDGKAVDVRVSERVLAAQIVATLQHVCKLQYGHARSPNLTPKSFSTKANDENPSENPKKILF